jgi:hypothetical protein
MKTIEMFARAASPMHFARSARLELLPPKTWTWSNLNA